MIYFRYKRYWLNGRRFTHDLDLEWHNSGVSHLMGSRIKFGFYDYKIFDIVYTQDSYEFRQAFEKCLMLKKLTS